MLLRATLVALLLACIAPFSRAQGDPAFPTDTAVQLLVTQTERAVQQYKALLDEEAVQLGKKGAEAVAKDRQVVHALEVAIKTFKAQPQGFNGPAGFAFFEWLDDASRNAVLCSSTSINQLSEQMMAGKTTNGIELMHLSQGCMDASTLLYTVGENAGALYERYVKAEQLVAEEGARVAHECSDALKKTTPARKQ
jgi:hypothetical protein